MNQEVNKNLPFFADKEIVSVEDDVLAITDQSIKLWKEMTVRALKLTSEKDWVNQDGKPYLQHSGIERVAKPYGLSLINVIKEKIVSQDDGGQYYIYVYEGDATMQIGKRLITQHAVGTCSSRDALYGKSGGVYKQLSQIDEPSVMKAAHTNLIVNAFTHILGLRNLTWEQLKAAGLNVDAICKVEYQTGNKGGSKEKDLTSDAQIKLKDILKWGFEMNDNDEKETARYFAMISHWEYKDDKGKDKIYEESNPKKWTEKGIQRRYDEIKKEYDKFQKAMEGGK